MPAVSYPDRPDDVSRETINQLEAYFAEWPVSPVT